MSIAENLSETLSTESLVMFGFCFGTIVILVLCIFLVACYNCACHGDVENVVLDVQHTTETENPLILKENPTKTKWSTMKRIQNENQNKSMEIAQVTNHRTKHETSV